MVRIVAISREFQPIYDLTLEELKSENILWYWMDFSKPSDEEASLLESYFKFHHLSIKDCMYSLNSPKLDYHSNYNFFILNALAKKSLAPVELSLFVREKCIVTYHNEELEEVDKAWDNIKLYKKYLDKGTSFILHRILDNIVDNFFPAIYVIENRLNEIERNMEKKPIHKLMNEIFEVRSDLLKLRRIINSMRDLLYRVVNSEKIKWFDDHKLYFSDIYQHLVKLSEMVDSNREITADMRDSYLSINSTRTNKHTMVLTVITSIFIPLTFIVGVYGMNFENMPELRMKYGYFIVLGVMLVMAILMFRWFKRKGWFEV